MLQGFGGNPRTIGNKRRNRSVSESAGGAEGSSTGRIRRLSGGTSTVTLPTSSTANATSSSSQNRSPSTSSVNLAQYRNRSGSFGSGRLGYPKRRNDQTSNSQRDLAKQQQQQSRSRHNSGNYTKTYPTVGQVTKDPRIASSLKVEFSSTKPAAAPCVPQK